MSSPVIPPVIATAAALAVAFVVLSACGAHNGGQSSGRGGDDAAGTTSSAPSAVPPSGPSVSPTVGPPEPAITEPANTVTPRPDAEQQVAVRWASAEPVPGESAVLVRGTLAGGPPCQVVGAVRVRESAIAVAITVRVGREPGADCSGPQVAVGFPYVVRVALDAPVGDRAIRDGAD